LDIINIHQQDVEEDLSTLFVKIQATSVGNCNTNVLRFISILFYGKRTETWRIWLLL